MEPIIFGIKDLLKNKVAFVIFGAAILITCIIFSSATQSVIESLGYVKVEGEGVALHYSAVPISTDMGTNKKLIQKLQLNFQEGGTSNYSHENLTMKLGYPTRILLNPSQNDQEKAIVYVSEAIYETVKAQEDTFPEPVIFQLLDKENFEPHLFDAYGENEALILVALSPSNTLENWIDTNQGLEIMELVENTRFTADDMRAGHAQTFLESFNGSFLAVVNHSLEDGEVTFIVRYVYPTLIMLLLMIIFSAIALYQVIFRKLYKEYTQHLLLGANIWQMFLRNSVFVCTVILTTFLLFNALNGFQLNLLFLLGLLFEAMIFITLEITLYVVLKRKNLSLNLKGDI